MQACYVIGSYVCKWRLDETWRMEWARQDSRKWVCQWNPKFWTPNFPNQRTNYCARIEKTFLTCHVTACPFINIHRLYSCRLFSWGSHCASALNHVILMGGGDSINSSIARLPLTSFRQERRKNKQRERAIREEILNLSLKFKQTLINFDSPSPLANRNHWAVAVS